MVATMIGFIKLIATLAAITVSISVSAQAFTIGLHGEVTDYFSGKPFRGAKVAVYGRGFADSVVTRMDGIYAFELQRDQFYTIVASRKDRIAKRLCIQTDSVPNYPDVPFYDMDVQITLFEPIPGFDFSLFEQPLGIAEYRNQVRNMSWENDYTERMERLLLRPTMREYEKAWAGYYERKSERIGTKIGPEIPELALLMRDSSHRSEWTRPTILIIDDSVTNSGLDTVEYWEEPEEPTLATPVLNVHGLFFTVQVGLYSNDGSLLFEEQVSEIRPLNSEQVDDGALVRYTTGRFANLADAQARMHWCQQNGVPDAFVTAYLDGSRITISKALDELLEHGPKIISPDIDRP